MPHKSYSDKLKDPRWQKVRLQILDRAEWKCEGCGATTKTLHVHHGYYARGVEPWEYETDTLWCLCEDCHQEAEERRRDVHLEVGRLHPLKDMTPVAVQRFSNPALTANECRELLALYRARNKRWAA